jgi:protein TonB
MIKSKDGKKPLVIIDGKESETDISTLDPDKIVSVSVWKDQAAVDKYGERARDGVIEVKTIKAGGERQGPPVYATVEKAETPGKEPYVVTEEMPSFPGGMEAMKKWVYSHMQVQSGMDFKAVKEPIYVVFTVGKDGKVRDAKVIKSVSPLFDAEAVRVVSSLPDFKPGYQNGKPVDVRMQLPIDFSAKVPAK